MSTNSQWCLTARPEAEVGATHFTVRSTSVPAPRDYFGRYAEVIPQLEAWVVDGSLKYQIDVLDGLDSTVEAMRRVFHGKNHGIQLVRLSGENPA